MADSAREHDAESTMRAARRERAELTMAQARRAGLLGGEKNARISARVQRGLIEAARRTTELESDTELLEYALARLAVEDDFGLRLLARKGRVGQDVDLDV